MIIKFIIIELLIVVISFIIGWKVCRKFHNYETYVIPLSEEVDKEEVEKILKSIIED